MFKLPAYQELERAAHEAHTSMRQVCLRAGISATIYYKWRSGGGSPTLKSLQKVLDVLNELSPPRVSSNGDIEGEMTGPRRFIIEWDDEETEWRAICPEWPSLSHFADTPENAFKGLIELISDARDACVQ